MGKSDRPPRSRDRPGDGGSDAGPGAPTLLKGREYSASVVLGDEGKPEVEFEGTRYPSLSAAGKAAAGYPVNGWRFWQPAIEQAED